MTIRHVAGLGGMLALLLAGTPLATSGLEAARAEALTNVAVANGRPARGTFTAPVARFSVPVASRFRNAGDPADDQPARKASHVLPPRAGVAARSARSAACALDATQPSVAVPCM